MLALYRAATGRRPSKTPTVRHNPHTNNLLIQAPRDNWAVIILMMYLNLREELEAWFNARFSLEGELATSTPSIELLCVALWLNKKEYLAILATSTEGSLKKYLGSRNAEQDILRHHAWHFALCGLGQEFIESAKEFLPLNKRGSGRISVYNPTTNISYNKPIIELHAALFSGKPHVVQQCVQAAYSEDEFYSLVFQELSCLGAWHAMLCCIANGYCDPIGFDLFIHLEMTTDHKTFQDASTLWMQLYEAPPTQQYTFKGVTRVPLLELVQSTTQPDLCFAYLAFHYTTHRNKDLYATCLRKLFARFDQFAPAQQLQLAALFQYTPIVRCALDDASIGKLDEIINTSLAPVVQSPISSATVTHLTVRAEPIG